MNREPEGAETEIFTSVPANQYNEGAYFFDATKAEGYYRATLNAFSHFRGLVTPIP